MFSPLEIAQIDLGPLKVGIWKLLASAQSRSSKELTFGTVRSNKILCIDRRLEKDRANWPARQVYLTVSLEFAQNF